MILIYDISMSYEDGRNADARVLRNVFKICKKYLTHIQNSVFEGELSPPQLAKLKVELTEHLRHDKDSCIIFHARNNTWMRKEFLTKEVDSCTQFI